jgi:hypothetical protein
MQLYLRRGEQRIDALRAMEAAQERLLANAHRVHDDVIRKRVERLHRCGVRRAKHLARDALLVLGRTIDVRFGR